MTTSLRRVGRPRQCPDEVLERALTLERSRLSLRSIADALNAEGVRTPAGGQPWTKSHVFRLLKTAAAEEMRRQLWPT